MNCEKCGANMIPGITPASTGWCSAECDLEEITVDTSLTPRIYYSSPNSLGIHTTCHIVDTMFHEDLVPCVPSRPYEETAREPGNVILSAKDYGPLELRRVWPGENIPRVHGFKLEASASIAVNKIDGPSHVEIFGTYTHEEYTTTTQILIGGPDGCHIAYLGCACSPCNEARLQHGVDTL